MTLWGRALLGALIGAVITLIAHPASRPFLIGPFIESGSLLNSPRFSLPTTFPQALPDPNDDISASLWIHVGAELVRKREKVTDEQLASLVKLARIRGSKDLENSFWKISEAVFLDKLGKPKAAVLAWREAAHRIRYDDYQTRYLARLREALGAQSASSSWQYAYCYRLRSVALAQMVEAYARNLIARTNLVLPEDLNLRYDTLIIGSIFRDGSRNLRVMQHAAQIVEIASHPREMHNVRSIRTLLMAHLGFKEAMRTAGYEDKAVRVEKVYNENDAWIALTAREDPEENLQNLTLMGALLPNLPGILLQSSLASLILWLLGYGLDRLTQTRRDLGTVTIGTIAALLPLSVLLLTGSWLAFLATALCGAFLLIGPRTPRAVPPRDLGPMFAFMNTVVAIALIVSATLLFVSRSLPLQASLPAMPDYVEGLADSAGFAALTLIILACLSLFSPLWALAQHVRTTTVISRAYIGTAAIAGVLSLVLAIAATPFCVSLETENQETLRKLMENEPVYYLR